MHACLVVSDSFATPWTVALQVPPSMGFPRQECCSGLPFPPPGDLPDRGIELASLGSPALTGRLFTTAPPGKPNNTMVIIFQLSTPLDQSLKRMKATK